MLLDWKNLEAGGQMSKQKKNILNPSLRKKKKRIMHFVGRRPKQTFAQGRHTEGEKAHEKMLNITNHEGNAN